MHQIRLGIKINNVLSLISPSREGIDKSFSVRFVLDGKNKTV